MIERAGDPTSFSYGIVITHLLEAHNIALSNYLYAIVIKSYNSRAFASIGYVSMEGTWVTKQDGEAKIVPSWSKAKVSVSQPSVCDPDLVEKLIAIDEKLTIIKDLLVSTQTTVADILEILKETG